VIATLGHAARREGRVLLHSLGPDRERLQLVSERVLLDDDARGNLRGAVYNARAGDGPARHHPGPDPRLHRPQGRHFRQHPGVPGMGEKTAAELDQFATARSRTCSPMLPRRRRARAQEAREETHAGRRSDSKLLAQPSAATSRSISTRPRSSSAPPDRSRLKGDLSAASSSARSWDGLRRSTWPCGPQRGESARRSSGCAGKKGELPDKAGRLVVAEGRYAFAAGGEVARRRVARRARGPGSSRRRDHGSRLQGAARGAGRKRRPGRRGHE